MSENKRLLPDLDKAKRFNVDVAPSVQFASRWAQIVEGMSGTKVIERAVLKFCDEIDHGSRSWRKYWEDADGSPAVAWTLMFADKSLPFDDNEQQIRDLLLAHERFFFEREGKTLKPKRRNIEALWPHIQYGTLGEHWQKTRSVDAWATGEKMADLLKKAKLKPPAWGPGHE